MANRALTKKQKLFVEWYLQLWTPSEAARQAGYKHADQLGARMLRHPLIATLIEQRMAEISMQTDEVLTRLTQQARTNVGDFLNFIEYWNPKIKAKETRVVVNWDMVKRYGYLVKKISYSRNGNPIVELHDAQAALSLIGKARRLFVDQVEEKHIDQPKVNVYVPDNGRSSVEGENDLRD